METQSESVGLFEKTPEQRSQDTAAAKTELLAALAEQQQVVAPEPVGVVEPVGAAPEAPADNSQVPTQPRDDSGRFAPKADVPAKFQKPDGSLDEGRLDKALSALEKLDKYKSLERDFHKSRQVVPEVAQPNQGFTPPQPQLPPAFQAQQANTPEMQAWMQQYSVADFAAAQRTAGLEAQIAEMKRDQRLKTLAETDPDFLDARVADEIGKLFQEKPHLWNTPDPYGEALLMAKGRLGERRSGQASPKQSPSATLTGGSTNVNAPAAANSASMAEESFKNLSAAQQREILMRMARPR